MNMDEEQKVSVIFEEESTETDLKNELKAAKEEIQGLTQQLNCLLLLAKK